MRNAIFVSAAVFAMTATLLGGAAFAEQILVGPTVERAKEMDGQLEFLRHCEVDRNPETADVVGETYLRGEFVPQDLKKAREFYRLAVTNAPEHVTNALKVLEFLLADAPDIGADREKAVERAVRRDPKTAAEIVEIKTWIPQLREIIRLVRKFALPKDGRWKGFDLTEDWVANVRTNRTISTHVRFRDEEWVPFLQRELTTDVSPDDPSREKVLALVANAAKWLWWHVHTPDSKQVSAAGMDDFLRERLRAGRDGSSGHAKASVPALLPIQGE